MVAEEPEAPPEPVRAPEPTSEPARVPPAEPAAVLPPADAGLEERWDLFLEAVRSRKRTTHALLKEAWPLQIAEGALVVGFERAFHAEAILRTEHAPHLATALQEAFGEKLRLRSEVLPGQRPGRAPVAASDATGTPDVDGPVGLVMRGLGAEIVEEVET